LKKLKIIGATMIICSIIGSLLIQKHLAKRKLVSIYMAITDFEPNEAAAIVLDYKLSDF
jgi:hypothetical protein